MKAGMRFKIVAELSVHPIGDGTSLSRYVRKAVKEIREVPGVRLMVTPMGTVVEADTPDQVFLAAKRAHEALFREGAKRVELCLRMDDRRDKERIMEDKVDAVK